MRKINLKDVPEQEQKSPKGKFGRITKNISVALGREPESLDLSKRHPFRFRTGADSEGQISLSVSRACRGIGALSRRFRARKRAR